MKFYAEKRESKDKKAYVGLYADLGYTKRPVTFDKDIIAELLDKSLRYVEVDMKVGDIIEIK